MQGLFAPKFVPVHTPSGILLLDSLRGQVEAERKLFKGFRERAETLEVMVLNICNRLDSDEVPDEQTLRCIVDHFTKTAPNLLTTPIGMEKLIGVLRSVILVEQQYVKVAAESQRMPITLRVINPEGK